MQKIFLLLTLAFSFGCASAQSQTNRRQEARNDSQAERRLHYNATRKYES